MKKLALTLGLGMLAATLTAGCGGGDGGGDGAGGVSSGVDSTKRGDEVTEEEAQRICEAVGDYVERKVSQIDLCKVAGVVAAQIVAGVDPEATDADLQAACSEGVQSCNEDEPEPIDPGTEDDCTSGEVPEECSSTVGEIEACLKDTVDMSFAMFTEVPDCGSLTRDLLESEEEEPGEPEMPASCETVQENCPEVFEEEVTGE